MIYTGYVSLMVLSEESDYITVLSEFYDRFIDSFYEYGYNKTNKCCVSLKISIQSDDILQIDGDKYKKTKKKI